VLLSCLNAPDDSAESPSFEDAAALGLRGGGDLGLRGGLAVTPVLRCSPAGIDCLPCFPSLPTAIHSMGFTIGEELVV